MSKEIQSDPRKKFVPFVLPWLLGAGMFGIYFLTLNHWITLFNVGPVAQVSGFTWQPPVFSPLQFLATLPLHILPTAKIPFALNLFSAVCAALTLVLLARCVTLLPQDRTEPQRAREKSDFAFLTGWPAYFPPVFAVLMMGLQLTFWENATSFTGEIFDLLIFSIIVWLLLEFRLDERPWRLTLATILLGAGIAESWAFVAFFPIFLTAIIWIKKLEFFNVRFLIRTLLFGLAGMAFFFLLPLLHHKMGIWEIMRPNIRADWMVVKAIQNGEVRHDILLASLSTLLPVLLIALRWSSGYGDSSRIGMALANNLIHVVHAAMLGVCTWVMFNPPFSAQELWQTPALTLNFFTALSIGYCIGYFLLVFGKNPRPSRRDPRPLPIFPVPLMWLAPVIVVGTLVFCGLMTGALIYKNHSLIKTANSDTLLKFADLSMENLPPHGAILLCDSDSPGQYQPLRAFLMQAALARAGRAQDFPVLDTQSLNWAPYYSYLHKKFPKQIPLITTNENSTVSPLQIFQMLISLSQSNTLCYLQPSYGYYFEQFYQEPHGLIYTLKNLPSETLLPPPLDQNLIAQNENFWDKTTAAFDEPIKNALIKPEDKMVAPKNLFDWLIMHLHPVPETDQNALFIGMLCSRSLDDWGVRLQRAGDLEKAALRFDQAKKFNPDNIVAGINLQFNEALRAGQTPQLHPENISTDAFGKYRNWNALANANGPFDEISYDFYYGFQSQNSGLFRQALAQFTRVMQLDPKNLAARFRIAQIYLLNHLPDRALDAIRAPLDSPAEFGLNRTNDVDLKLLAAAVQFQKNEIGAGSRILENQIALHPDDDVLRNAAVGAFLMHGLYTNAMQAIDDKLARSPDDLPWLFGKGTVNLKAGHFSEAIASFTRVLDLQTNNPDARFNRALAYLDTTNFPAARADYLELQNTYSNSFQVAFGLAEIGWRQHDTNEAIRNYQIFLANAPTNLPESKTVVERLNSLKR